MRGSYGPNSGYGTYGSPSQAIVPIRVPVEGQQDIVLYDPRMNQGTPGAPSGLDLREMWRTIVRHKWVIVVITLVLLSTTLAGTLLMRPVYRSTTMIEVNPKHGGSNIKFQNVDKSDYSSREYISTQANILKSESVAGAVIESLELEQNPELTGKITQRGLLTGVQRALSTVKTAVLDGIAGKKTPEPSLEETDPERAAQDRHNAMLQRFYDRLGVRNVPDSTLFEVSFESFNPKLASAVANSIAEQYIRLSDTRRFSSSEASKNYLQGEIERIKAKLESSEKELTEFARAKDIIDVEERGNIMTQRLEELAKRLTDIQDERIAAESAYEQAKEGRADTLPAVVDLTLIERLREKLAEVNSEHARLSGIFKPEYPLIQQLESQRDKIQSGIDDEVARIVVSLETKYEELLKREEKLAAQLKQQRQDMLNLKDRSVQYNILKREWETNKELYSGLLERMKEVGIAAGAEASAIAVIDKARTPSSAYKPRLRFNLAIAGILGVILGIGLALLLAYLDNTISNGEELERVTQMASLTLVPSVDTNRLAPAGTVDLIAHEERNHEAAEAFRALRTSLMFSTPGGAPRSIVVTSSQSGEGKSMTSVNLAIVLAQSDARVLLIDADLRRPRGHKILGVPVSPGLSEELVGSDEECIIETTIPNLDFLPAGTLPPNPAELVSSTQMDELLAHQSEQYDYVIVDAPPVLAIADPVILSTKVDGVVVVVSANQVTKDAVYETIKRLRMVQAPVLGGVLNRVNMKDASYGQYGAYYYGYGDDDRTPSAPVGEPYAATAEVYEEDSRLYVEPQTRHQA